MLCNVILDVHYIFLEPCVCFCNFLSFLQISYTEDMLIYNILYAVYQVPHHKVSICDRIFPEFSDFICYKHRAIPDRVKLQQQKS